MEGRSREPLAAGGIPFARLGFATLVSLEDSSFSSCSERGDDAGEVASVGLYTLAGEEI
jgi:hypothetical protein